MNPVWRSTFRLSHHAQKPWKIHVARPRAIVFRTAQIPSLGHSPRSLSTTSNESEQNQHNPDDTPPQTLPLLRLPPPVKGWPSFWVIRKDIEEYLYPLYARGWGVKFLPRKNYYSISHDRYVAYLTTEYSFSNFNCAAQFIADLTVLANKEKHHPSILTLRNATRPTLSLFIQTDSALRPRWNEEDPSADPPLSRRVPGITRRDLRFAALLEEQYDEYQRTGKALELRGKKVKTQYNTPSWEHLVSRFVKCTLNTKLPKDLVEREERKEWLQILEDGDGDDASAGGSSLRAAGKKEQWGKAMVSAKEEATEVRPTKCLACEGPHMIQDCTVRDQHKPPTLCYICLEPHWWLDCPQRDVEAASPPFSR